MHPKSEWHHHRVFLKGGWGWARLRHKSFCIGSMSERESGPHPPWFAMVTHPGPVEIVIRWPPLADAMAGGLEPGAEPVGDGGGRIVPAANKRQPAQPVAEAEGGNDPRAVEAVLFDLDNTLVDLIRVKRDASAACARAMIAAGADLGLPAEEAGSLLFEHYMDHGIESDTAFETFLRRNLRNKMRLSQSAFDRTLAAGINAYLRAKASLMEPYPGVGATLVELVRRGYRLGVVTDAPRLKAWQRLWSVQLADFFEVVVTRMEHTQAKPDTGPFLTALEALALPPHQVAMVGDWTERDVIGGNRVGLFTVHARYGRAGTEDLRPVKVEGLTGDDDGRPDAVVDSFDGLLRVFPGVSVAP